jgi:hypothetical protein
MSTRYICDYPDCEREAVTRISEERLDDLAGVYVVGQAAPTFGRSLDSCQEHRTVTHPGWWCLHHEEALREQAHREAAS